MEILYIIYILIIIVYDVINDNWFNGDKVLSGVEREMYRMSTNSSICFFPLRL